MDVRRISPILYVIWYNVFGDDMAFVKHEFPPCFDENSEILILGSIPSIKSREVGFYYGHPKNRFWKVLECIYQETISEDIESKKSFLKRYHIALWDVLASCEIKGSSDASIENPIPNDINFILDNSKVKRIYTSGKKAYELYQKYCYPITKKEAILLPSTSPANAAMNLEKLIQAYKIIL